MQKIIKVNIRLTKVKCQYRPLLAVGFGSPLFSLVGSLALVSEPNLRFCALCTISFGNPCATFHLDFSLNMWYYILVKRGTDTQSKRIEKTETKKFLKIF
jgi:hypothetical protein